MYCADGAGRDATRQLSLGESPSDPAVELLQLLEARPLSAAYILRKIPLAAKVIRSLERKGLIVAETVQADRDPLRAPSARLRVELVRPPGRGEAAQGRARADRLPGDAPRLAQSQGSRRVRQEWQRGGPLARPQGIRDAQGGAVRDCRPSRPPAPRAECAPASGVRRHPRRRSRLAAVPHAFCCLGSPARERPRST